MSTDKFITIAKPSAEFRYEYNQSFVNPFIVSAYIDGTFFDSRVSANSFDEAKQTLVQDLRVKLGRPIPKIPPTETILLEDMK